MYDIIPLRDDIPDWKKEVCNLRNWLKELRTASGMTQEDVAKKLEISQHYYANIENGKRQADLNLSIMNKLSEIFDISIEQIAEYEAESKEGV